MELTRSRCGHASNTREPAPGSKSLFPLQLRVQCILIKNFFNSFNIIQYYANLPSLFASIILKLNRVSGVRTRATKEVTMYQISKKVVFLSYFFDFSKPTVWATESSAMKVIFDFIIVIISKFRLNSFTFLLYSYLFL